MIAFAESYLSIVHGKSEKTMSSSSGPKKTDLTRDLDHNGIVDASDDRSRDLDRDGVIDTADRSQMDLNGDNLIDGTDQKLGTKITVGTDMGWTKENGAWTANEANKVQQQGRGPKVG